MISDELESIILILGLLLSAIALWLQVKSDRYTRKSIKCEDSSKLLQYFNQGRSNSSTYIVKKLIEALFDIKNIREIEIDYLYSLNQPLEFLVRYSIAKKYLRVGLSIDGELRLFYHVRYISQLSRSWRKQFYTTIYFLGLAIVLSTLALTDRISVISIIIPVSGSLALFALKKFGEINRAEYLIQKQRERKM